MDPNNNNDQPVDETTSEDSVVTGGMNHDSATSDSGMTDQQANKCTKCNKQSTDGKCVPCNMGEADCMCEPEEVNPSTDGEENSAPVM